MSGLTTFAATRSATSSPASLDGLPLFAWLDGQTTGKSGPAPAPASPSAPPESSEARPTSAICGPNLPASSASAALQSSLASRLQARLAGRGSALFVLTWKAWGMQSGPPICALRASAPRTSGNGSGGWPTPNAGPQNDTDTRWEQRRAETKARVGNGNGFGLTLGMAASLSPWPAASARDWKGATHDRWGTNARPLNEVARLASWATPGATDGDKADATLPVVMQRVEAGKQMGVAMQARMTAGPTSPGSPAATEKPGQLNPAFSLWLMGYPAEWLWNAPSDKAIPRFRKPSDGSAALAPSEGRATPSSRKSRPSS
jgi:hypothetical protein